MSSIKRLAIAVVEALWLASAAIAETIVPKYGAAVDLASFSCSDVTRSSFIKRVWSYRRKLVTEEIRRRLEFEAR
jgi:hypothetical protein